MVYSVADARRRAEAEDVTFVEVDEQEPARPPRHAPPRPARRRRLPAGGGEPDRD